MCSAITNDNQYVISGCTDKQLMIWSLSTGLVEHKLAGHTEVVTTVRCTKDGNTAVSGKKI